VGNRDRPRSNLAPSDVPECRPAMGGEALFGGYYAPVISLTFPKNARLRSVLRPQFTGGDW
jgi:hypothetical protein